MVVNLKILEFDLSMLVDLKCRSNHYAEFQNKTAAVSLLVEFLAVRGSGFDFRSRHADHTASL